MDEAVKQAALQMDKVRANAMRYNQNFTGVMPHDRELQQKETKEYLDDLTTRDQRMLLCCLTLMHMADSQEEMNRDPESILSIASKHLCQMSTQKYQQDEVCEQCLQYRR